MKHAIVRTAAKLVIGAMLLVTMYSGLTTWFIYQRELRFAQKIEAIGGKVHWRFSGPKWTPSSIQARLPFAWRVNNVYVSEQTIPAEIFRDIAIFECLESINFSSTNIIDADLEHLRGLKELYGIGLSDTQIGNAGLEKLKSHSKLEILWLDRTQVTDSGLDQLKGLNRLECLLLCDTSVSDSAVDYLQELKSLRRLSLKGTQITDQGLSRLACLNRLISIWVDDTKVTSEGKVSFQQALPTCQFESDRDE